MKGTIGTAPPRHKGVNLVPFVQFSGLCEREKLKGKEIGSTIFYTMFHQDMAYIS